MNIWERLSNLDRRVYYVLLIMIVAWPILKPWGLPIRTGRESQSFYDTIEGLPQGATIALAIDYRSDCIVELNPQVATLYKHAWSSKNAKIIMWSMVDEGANVTQALVEPLSDELGKTYGVDWINLGYKPGGDVTRKKMIDDFWEGAGYADIEGRGLENFPIMENFDSVTDADLLVHISGVVPGSSETFLKIVSIPTGLPMAVGTTAIQGTSETPYFASGQYKGFLVGLRGAAEYEFLTQQPGPAIVGMDAQSAAHFLVIGLILLGNVGYFATKKMSKTEGGR
ncbi:MAG: hypothetical protein ACOX3V_05855 [Bacillota bacterium]|jgi:hypothetical protein